ncbi:hypothetical protein MOF28_15455 [Bacillus haynesii]|uniref:hypothetical protein n=1 Tax=Bacillus haynesii TaxID=1925021 RepID=UPI00227D9ED7|nr:hypothetical protein [Bacillus haynesii]MCY9339751.1 hypothetical protein [Bacillus haynesii]
MGNIEAEVSSIHRLDIPVNSSNFTVITGVAIFGSSGTEGSDGEFQINFNFNLDSIDNVINQPIGTANIFADHSSRCSWKIKDFSANWKFETKEIYCSLFVTNKAPGKTCDNQYGSFPFQVFIHHIKF